MSIIVHSHLGAGDHIITAPIIAKLATEHDEVFVPCHPHNVESVKSFFINFDNVRIITGFDEVRNIQRLNLGYYNKDLPRKNGESFIDWFYRGYGVSRNEMLEFCPLKKAAQRVGQLITPYEDFIFIHEDKQRRFNINSEYLNPELLVLTNSIEGSILRYANVIGKAKEIHVIDSSFLHLCEALETTGKLYYHKYPRASSEDYKFLKDWEVIN